jgi:hypothetical protein
MEIEIIGLQAALQKLDPKKLLKPLKDYLTRLAIATQTGARDRAPVDTGRLVTSIGYNAPDSILELDNAELPLWVRVGSNVNAYGFYYPRALDEGEQYHYRGKHPALVGQPTRGWFSDVPGMLTTQYNEIGDRFLSDVADIWGKQ